jgi:hypothetical protein
MGGEADRSTAAPAHHFDQDSGDKTVLQLLVRSRHWLGQLQREWDWVACCIVLRRGSGQWLVKIGPTTSSPPMTMVAKGEDVLRFQMGPYNSFFSRHACKIAEAVINWQD